jgi:hypothetical protein
MPRTARASAGGYCYHVINRGNARGAVFHKEKDLIAFVGIMRVVHPSANEGGGVLPDAEPLSSGRLASGRRRPEPLDA